MAGLTDTGFTAKNLNDIYTDKAATAVQLFQDQVDVGDVVDTSDSSILGRLISLDTPSESDLWQAAEQVYSAFDPNSATGIALDNLVALDGTTRKQETFSTVSIVFSGSTYTSIPAGSSVSSSTTSEIFTTNTLYSLDPSIASGITISVLTATNTTLYTITYVSNTTTNTVSYTSDSSATVAEILNGLQAVIVSAHPTLVSSVVGTTLVIDRVEVFQTAAFTTSANLGITKVRIIGQAIADVAGPIAQAVGTIDTISTPILGLDSVINPTSAVVGSLEETDEELRLRFANSKYELATNSFDAVYSAINNLDNVVQEVIYENDTSVTDSNGVPGHSFLPIVLGGVSTDIANAIWDNKPIGILSYGNTSVNVIDSQGFTHVVSFSRPNPLTIYITMDITTDSTFPPNGDDAIRSSIISYFNTNLKIGDDVIYSRMYTPINAITGFQVNSLEIGIAASPTGTSNITVPFDGIASINSSNIVIT